MVRVGSRTVLDNLSLSTSACGLVGETEPRMVGTGSESDHGGPEEYDDSYGGGFPGGRRGDSRGVGCGEDRVPGDRITGWM